MDIDGGRSFDRIQSNAGNIGFAASVDTGMNGIHVNLQCEQFTYYNHFAGGTGWCNRNSKIGLSHPQMGEIMFATWLLPYNEGVAQWVDPFYDAGADSHTSIMGSVGAHTIFYNTGDFDQQASASGPNTGFDGAEFNYAGGGYDTGFNRRQENIIQYWSPNWNGFVFRFAWTVGNRDETKGLNKHETDPVIRSSSLAYTNGPVWVAVTWQDHEDWTANAVGKKDCGGKDVHHCMESSDAESIRIAGRYIMDLGDGMSVQLSAMYEDLEYEFNGVVDVDTAMSVFGYGGFASSYDLFDSAGLIEPDAAPSAPVEDDIVAAHKTLGLWDTVFDTDKSGSDTGLKPPPMIYKHTGDNPDTADVTETDYVTYSIVQGDGVSITPVVPEPVDPSARLVRPTTTPDPDAIPPPSRSNMISKEYLMALQAEVARQKTAAAATGATDEEKDSAYEIEQQYMALVEAAKESAADDIADANMEHADALEAWGKDGAGSLAAKRATETAGANVKIEREAWMVSGKIKFGGPVDFRFSYMDADDLEVSCGSACRGDWDETAAEAWNVGMFYTMPAGTELRLTYSEVDNDDNGTYGQGISGTGLGTAGNKTEMFAVGIVHWFD